MYYSAIEEPKSKDRATDEGTGQNRKKYVPEVKSSDLPSPSPKQCRN